MNVVIAGGSGQIGRILARWFMEKGDRVVALARHTQRESWRTAIWNGRDPDEWAFELDGAGVLINLAGRSVNCRYTRAHRREILESRVETTRLLGRAIAQLPHPPKLWINASTATIYRHALDRPMDELTGEIGGHEPGVPQSWRFSIEVATGGVLATLLALVRLGLGGAAGPGTQFVSWIHDLDFCRALDFLIAHPELDGAVNVASPNPLPNREFMRNLRETCGRRFGLAATKWMLEIGAFVHRTETELLLKSRRVVPSRLVDAGFSFEFPSWDIAARDLVRRWH